MESKIIKTKKIKTSWEWKPEYSYDIFGTFMGGWTIYSELNYNYFSIIILANRGRYA